MKELKKEDLQITELIHHFVREHVEAGDICIDATAGCGNDTLFLCELTGARGEVMAFDIQPQALEKTATLLAEHECMAELVLDSHSNMADYMSEGSAALCLILVICQVQIIRLKQRHRQVLRRLRPAFLFYERAAS